MITHLSMPEDYSDMITVNTFGDPDYVTQRLLEGRGIPEIWIYNLKQLRVVSYKKIE